MSGLIIDLFYSGRKVAYDAKGYPVVSFGGRNARVHILEWEKHFGPKPAGHDIHHRDRDKTNWAIGNLECLTKHDHQRVHAGWVQTDGAWTHKPCNACKQVLPLVEFYQRKGRTPSAKCKRCHCECTDKQQRQPGVVERVRSRKARWAREKRAMIRANYSGALREERELPLLEATHG